ncbi:hypothetical protein KR032_003530 [Drosophila birchii]|nr:hypothetical protein KR032_003530 [Drosophila birchii]
MEKDQLDQTSSYDSLARRSSSTQEDISPTNSNVTFMEHSTPSVLQLPPKSGKKERKRDRDRDRDLDLSDGESYQEVASSEAIGSKLKEELSKYKQELKEYNDTTKELEEKYMKINYELNEMQQKHDQFVEGRRKHPTSEVEMESEADPEDPYYNSVSSATSQMTIRRKSPEVMQSNTSFMTVLSAQSSYDQLARKKKYSSSSGRNSHHQSQPDRRSPKTSKVYDNRIVEALANRNVKRRKRSSEQLKEDMEPAALKEMYHVLSDVINTPQVRTFFRSMYIYITYTSLVLQDRKYKHERDREAGNLGQLLTTIKSLKSEQVQFRSLIQQQHERIADYHTRCVKAQEIMNTQKHEIDKLNANNKQLESSIYHDIDSLRCKIDTKLKSVSHLPKMMREEHTKYEKVMRENCLLADKLHVLQQEAMQLKVKIDELGRRKQAAVNRLKAAEKDLKIFKNYNSSLKSEKTRLSRELTSMKDQLEQLQVSSKRQLSRHREQSEKQRRDLQKRIYDLELKLGRSQNSTTSLIQERDSLIAELQTQLHTLVHNFEVSQKHIRVLRRHIYSMTNPNGGVGINSSGAAGIANGSQRPSLMRINQACSSSTMTGRLGNPRLLKEKI